MAYHNLLSKCDRALVAYLISAEAGTTADVFPAKRAASASVQPYTVCFSESATETVAHSGTYTVKASIEVHTNAAPDYNQDTDQMRTDSDDRTAATFDALHDQYTQSGGELADLITTAAAADGIANFHVQDVRVTSVDQGHGEAEGEWIDTLNIELLCDVSE